MLRHAMRLLMVAALFPASGAAQAVAPGTRAPEIDLPTLGGGRIKLSALRGHPVVVTFWGSWCRACRDEFPELVAVQKKYAGTGLQVVAVNQRDQELSITEVESLVKEYSVVFTVALDQHGQSRRSFRLLSIPTTVFVDSAGIIQRIHSGPIDHAALALGLVAILPPK